MYPPPKRRKQPITIALYRECALLNVRYAQCLFFACLSVILDFLYRKEQAMMVFLGVKETVRLVSSMF